MKARAVSYRFLLAVVLLLVVVNKGIGDTPVSGPITSDTTWTLANSPYIVTGNVLVMNGVTLRIEPGITVKFNSTKALQIDGTLIARGTSENKIVFTSNQPIPTPGDWGYILFSDSSTDATYDANGVYTGGSILQHCIVEYAGGVSVSNNGAVRINRAHPFINNCTVRYNKASGINAYNLKGNLKITNSIIRNNEASGIVVNDLRDTMDGPAMTVSITNSFISNNIASSSGGGIYIYIRSYYSDIVTIKNNIISNNTSFNSGGGVYIFIRVFEGRATFNITNNTIIGNTSQNGSAIDFYEVYSGWPGRFYHRFDIKTNIITGNIANGTPPTSTIYNGNSLPLFNYNNIFNNNATYEFYNNNDYNAQGIAYVNDENNWWGTTGESEIQEKIYDWFDNSSKGIVDYFPYEADIRTDAPISPPTGLAVSTTDTDIILTWAPNPEGDVAGYKVYWGKQEPPFFENVANVGNSLGHTIPGLTAGIYYVGVTAYDTNYVDANDDPNTTVNENQTNGNESWYATTLAFVGTPEPRVLTLLTPNGGERLVAGKTSAISWQSPGPINNVLIEYSTNNGSNWIPIGTVSNTGFYEWLLPAVTSERCLVVITDAGNLAIRDTSDDVFTIIQCLRSISSDLNEDCYVDFYDFALFVEDWLQCGNPLDPDCQVQ